MSNKILKILLFSDLHIGKLNSYISNATSFYENILNEIFSFKFDKWVFLGDLVDNVRKKLFVPEINLFITILSYIDKNLSFILGNHDLILPSSFNEPELITKEPFSYLLKNNKKLQFEYNENYKTLFISISYISPFKKEEIYNYIEEQLNIIKRQNIQVNNIIGFTHLDFEEIFPLVDGFSFDKLSEILHNKFNNANIIFFNGHYHEKFKYDNQYAKLIGIGSCLINENPLSPNSITNNNIPSIVILKISDNKVSYDFYSLESALLYITFNTSSYKDLSQVLQYKNPLLLQYKDTIINYDLVNELLKKPNVANVILKKQYINNDNDDILIEQTQKSNEEDIYIVTDKIIKEKIKNYLSKNENLNDKMKKRIEDLINKT